MLIFYKPESKIPVSDEEQAGHELDACGHEKRDSSVLVDLRSGAQSRMSFVVLPRSDEGHHQHAEDDNADGGDSDDEEKKGPIFDIRRETLDASVRNSLMSIPRSEIQTIYETAEDGDEKKGELVPDYIVSDIWVGSVRTSMVRFSMPPSLEPAQDVDVTDLQVTTDDAENETDSFAVRRVLHTAGEAAVLHPHSY